MAADCQHGLSACPCAGTCDCLPRLPAVIKTKPTLMSRLRRWWALRQLREELAGLDADRELVLDEISLLLAATFLPQSLDASMAPGKLQMRRLELLDITRRRLELLARLAKVEAKA